MRIESYGKIERQMEPKIAEKSKQRNAKLPNEEEIFDNKEWFI